MFQSSGPLPKVSQTNTSRSGSGKVKGLNRVALITLKIVVLAPMPSASVSTATTVRPRFFISIRMPYRRSCRSVVMDHSENRESRMAKYGDAFSVTLPTRYSLFTICFTRIAALPSDRAGQRVFGDVTRRQSDCRQQDG